MPTKNPYDFVGTKVEMLHVVSVVIKEYRGCHRKFLNCICECGKEGCYLATQVLGHYRLSCGCERLRRLSAKITKHGAKSKRVYRIWKNIRDRCKNPKNPGYKNYGGRGLSLHPDLDQFNDFYSHLMAMLPEGSVDVPKGLSIDRIDNNRGYEPGNLRLTDRVTQNRNRRNIKEVTIGDESMIVADWLRRIGINHSLYCGRLKRGWSKEKALTTPKKTDCRFTSKS